MKSSLSAGVRCPPRRCAFLARRSSTSTPTKTSAPGGVPNGVVGTGGTITVIGTSINRAAGIGLSDKACRPLGFVTAIPIVLKRERPASTPSPCSVAVLQRPSSSGLHYLLSSIDSASCESRPTQ